MTLNAASLADGIPCLQHTFTDTRGFELARTDYFLGYESL